MALHFQSLDANFGARVVGLAPAAVADGAIVAALRQGLVDHGVLLIRGAAISPAQLVELGRAFGQLEILPEPEKRHPDHTEIFKLTNVRPDGNVVVRDEPQAVLLRGTERWHTDSLFRPALGAQLRL